MSGLRVGVFPGSFDPPTIAHVAIAEAALRQAGLDRIDFAISRVALGKEDRTDVDRRRRALERVVAGRDELGVVVTNAQLVADIAAGYDAVVMGADKWAQVNDPEWYPSIAARDDALARLPRVLVAPRPGFGTEAIEGTEGAEALDLDAGHAAVSSSAARAGTHDYVAPGARRRLIVDAMNVIGSRPDGWWRDRDGAARRLITSLQEYSRRGGDRIALVLDGRPIDGFAEGLHDGVLVAYATRRGPNAADDRIVEEVAGDRDPATLTVVTSDRALRARVVALGAAIESPSQLLSDLASASP
jgi:nicotinic acid mononucleotide adenylyltransferase/predicted RNA-binding protein with PIN domain